MLRIIVAVVALLIAGAALAREPTPEAERIFVRERLVDALRLMDEAFRVPETGQYRDAVRIGQSDQSGLPSSIAATGIGLVSLALGDALGVVPGAEEKARVTLLNLLNEGESGFRVRRSPSGWYPHFIDPLTGTPHGYAERQVSTIDTALLAAGAAIAGGYFNAKAFTEGRGEAEVAQLADRLIGGVDWSSAIKDVDRGLVHLVFEGPEEIELTNVFANPFDEYALLPCLAMRGEQLAGELGPAHALFARHYADARTLPMGQVGEVSVINKPGGAFIAHFTHLFVYFYCNGFNSQPAYEAELRELAQADRAHFVEAGEGRWPRALWGLGAGSEVKFRPDGSVEYTAYGVNHLADNPFNTASPAIMAGLAAAYGPGEAGDPIPDLMTLWREGACRYEHEGLEFLWRCSARDPSIPVARVEGVDFSTYILGLAARDPAFGMAFFRAFNL